MEELIRKVVEEAVTNGGGKFKITINVEVEAAKASNSNIIRDDVVNAPARIISAKSDVGLMGMFDVPLPEAPAEDGELNTVIELPWHNSSLPGVDGTADSDRPVVSSPL